MSISQVKNHEANVCYESKKGQSQHWSLGFMDGIMAKEKNYDVIFGDSVLFASTRVDLTNQVLEKLQQEFNQTAANKPAQ